MTKEMTNCIVEANNSPVFNVAPPTTVTESDKDLPPDNGDMIGPIIPSVKAAKKRDTTLPR